MSYPTRSVCTQDRAVPIAAQRAIVAELDHACGTATATVELVSSHSPFLSHPDALADMIARQPGG